MSCFHVAITAKRLQQSYCYWWQSWWSLLCMYMCVWNDDDRPVHVVKKLQKVKVWLNAKFMKLALWQLQCCCCLHLTAAVAGTLTTAAAGTLTTAAAGTLTNCCSWHSDSCYTCTCTCIFQVRITCCLLRRFCGRSQSTVHVTYQLNSDEFALTIRCGKQLLFCKATNENVWIKSIQ